jgi:hypothetical protein
MGQFTKLNTDPDCTFTRGELLRYREAEYQRVQKKKKEQTKGEQ